MTKIAIFADVQNIYYTTRDIYKRSFNYKRLWQVSQQLGEIVVANAYAIQRAEDGQIKFQDALRHIGFEVKLKPFIQRSDGSAKGDWDVGITIDMMETAPQVDRIILLSGDGDFDRLVQHVKKKGCFVDVYGVEKLTADSLKHAADRFTAINCDLLL